MASGANVMQRCGLAAWRLMMAAPRPSSEVAAPILCGRGDKKTKKGKRFKGSYGNARPKKEKMIERIKDKVEVPRVVLLSPFFLTGAKMPGDIVYQHPLFGGKISSIFPNRFQDVSNIREVPDHQEVFADPGRDESLISELLEYKPDVADNGSAAWFLQDLANEQDAEGSVVIEQSGVLEAPGLAYQNIPAVVTTAVGQMAISKGRQGREAQNIVKVYLANLRLKGVDTDVIVTAYEPIVINPLSESADTIGAGVAVPAAQAGCMPMDEVFKLAVTSFKVYDWSLFNVRP